MHPCSQYAERIFNDPKINTLIGKIQPTHLQADLRQEILLEVLTIDCNKIVEISARNKLTDYVAQMVCRMAFSKTSKFYYQFKKNNNDKAIEYLASLQPSPEIPTAKAQQYLNEKQNIDAINWHEVAIFRKYVEIGSMRGVARYFDVSVDHIWDVVNKVRNEIKSTCFTNS